tara:strand:- start:10772 stop:10954 length:183 start_codon:yes stop_codon:yes gene_type:complete
MTTKVTIETNTHPVKVFLRDPRSTAVVAQKEIVAPHSIKEYYLHSGLSIECIELPEEKET